MKLFSYVFSKSKESSRKGHDDDESTKEHRRELQVREGPYQSAEKKDRSDKNVNIRASVLKRLELGDCRVTATSMIELSDGTIVTGLSRLCPPFDPSLSTICRWTSDFSRLIRMYGNVHEDGQVMMEIDRRCVGDTNSKGSLYFASRVFENYVANYVVWNANTGQVVLTHPIRGTHIHQNIKVPCFGFLYCEVQKDMLYISRVWGTKHRVEMRLIVQHQFSEEVVWSFEEIQELEDGRLIVFCERGNNLAPSERFLGLCVERDGNQGTHGCTPISNPFRLQRKSFFMKEIEHGLLLVSVADSLNIGLWNIDTGSVNYDFLAVDTPGVKEMAVSLDKRSIITYSKKGFSIWRAKDGLCIGRIELSIVAVRAIIPIRGNKFVAATLFQSELHYLEDCLIEINVPPSASSSETLWSEDRFPLYVGNQKEIVITELEDGSFLCGVDTTITRWCFSRDRILQTFPSYSNQIRSIAQIDRKTFASFEVNNGIGTVRIYSLRKGQCKLSFDVGPVDRSSYHLSKCQMIRLRNGHLASFWKNIAVSAWSLEGKNIQNLVDTDATRDFSSICELDDGRLVTGCNKGQIKVWCLGDDSNLETGCVKTLGKVLSDGMAVTHVAQARRMTMTRDGRLLVEAVVVSCLGCGRVTVWDLEAGCSLTEFSHIENESSLEPHYGVGWTFYEPREAFTAMTLLEDRTLICTSKRGLIKVWNLTGCCLSAFSFVALPFPMRSPEVRNIVETTDGRLILGYNTGMIKVIRRPVR